MTISEPKVFRSKDWIPIRWISKKLRFRNGDGTDRKSLPGVKAHHGRKREDTQHCETEALCLLRAECPKQALGWSEALLRALTSFSPL
ncbi:hypothetical protein [Parageobacillus toebii]|uniref:hypothetical protein n=1 Tax=Parageobacillus toebii TaxID=153151 RepID=UPI001968419A|nr:hypothetical protein [Parageobacillus toebii]QSB50614.1 hypothetical protein JTI59_17785 [Parageobacillus toebii]